MVDITLLELHTGDMDLGKYGSKLSTVADEAVDDEDLSEKVDVQTDFDEDDSSGGKGKALLLSLLLLGVIVAAAKFMGGDDFEDLEELEELDDLAENP